MPDESPRWSTDQVLALAADPGTRSSGQSLATPGRWRDTGCGGRPPGVWGLCMGSARTPYQICVDLTGPAYRCSCPSRRSPCKHVVGLLLLWAGSDGPAAVPAAKPPDWVAGWQSERAGRAVRAQVRARPATEDGSVAAASRTQTQNRRAQRIEAGIDELERWLSDQVRQGIAGAARAGYHHWDAMAARLVDAQAPALASRVRRLASVSVAPDRLLTELSLVRLLVSGYRRADDLPANLVATVRSRIGFPVTTEEVLAGDPVLDEWTVLGIRDELDERLNLRRVWLRGTTTGREALILSFAPPGTPLPSDLELGTSLEAGLCYFPGRGNLRAIVKNRVAQARPVAHPPGASATIADALRRYAGALADDPWQDRVAMVLADVTMLAGDPASPRRDGGADGWFVVDRDGAALAVNPWGQRPWRLLAAAGGAPATIAGEWSTDGLRPLAVWTDGRLVGA